MDSSFLSFAILIEVIVLMAVWILFLHWRIKKHKNARAELEEQQAEQEDDFDIYMHYLNRQLADTKAHLDDLAENQSEDIEAINMYQYRVRHLEAEHSAMHESHGNMPKFWEVYRSNIDFIYTQPDEPESEAEVQSEPEPAREPPPDTGISDYGFGSIQQEFDGFRESHGKVLEQSGDVVDLVRTLVAKSESEELRHMLELLEHENDTLKSRLRHMEREFEVMMHNAALSHERAPVSAISRDVESVSMANVAMKQNARISELNDIVGNLSLELEEKSRLAEESQWVTRQMKELEHVIVILEDENKFLRQQIKELLEKNGGANPV